MIGLTTREAFEQLIAERGFHNRIEGMTPEVARQIRFAYKNEKVSLDKIEELLNKSGYNVIQEKLWKL